MIIITSTPIGRNVGWFRRFLTCQLDPQHVLGYAVPCHHLSSAAGMLPQQQQQQMYGMMPPQQQIYGMMWQQPELS